MSSPLSLLRQHPQWPAARRIVETLQAAGHRALLAGGCVRDALLGVLAQDLDVATSATPDQVIALFAKTVEVGKAFGVVRVIEDGLDLEVATFREDGPSADGRRPTEVHFSDDKRDALRRDFTVNALFFDLPTEEVIDHVNGRADLQAKVLRTVGDPELRFAEDHLRLLRAVRFSVQLGFQFEPATWASVLRNAPLAATVSRERIRDEMFKMLKAGKGALGPICLRESGLLGVLFPDMVPTAAETEARAEVLLREPGLSRDVAFTYWLSSLAKDKGPLESTLKSLKLSKSEERSVLLRLQVFASPESLWQRGEGGQILMYDEKEVREGLELREKMFGLDPRQRSLHQRWLKARNSGEALPPRLLTGRQMPPTLQGAAMGAALQAAYEAQLEGKFEDAPGALTWLEQWLRLKKG